MLDEYKQKRNFKMSPEPEPDGGNGSERKNENIDKVNHLIPANHGKLKRNYRFVFQRHKATHLHYDFRLESVKNNVLLSWAIPKGPSLDPYAKRLAIQTEDHPIDYLTFEGIIPKGNYGAGSVIVWDIGTYSIEFETTVKSPRKKTNNTTSQSKDISDIISTDRKVTFNLYGQKIKGKFSLIKTKTANQWLLIKHKDEYAIEESSKDKKNKRLITESHTKPELTEIINTKISDDQTTKIQNNNFKVDEIDAEHDRHDEFGYHLDDNPEDKNADKSSKNHLLKLLYFERAKPMLSCSADSAFNNRDWVFEIKWDGVRAIAFVDKQTQTCKIKSRSGEDITYRYPELERALKKAFIQDKIRDFVILDGEIVILDSNGHPDFQKHQKRMNIASDRNIQYLSKISPAVFYVFDILYLDGHNLTSYPFIQRRNILSGLFTNEKNNLIRISDFIEEVGITVFETIQKMNLEGIIAKLKTSRYIEGMRSRAWLKIKNVKTQDCIIIGYTKGEGTRKNYFGSLLLASIDSESQNTTTINNPKLRFVGHTGSGFSIEVISGIYEMLRNLVVPSCPIDHVPYLNRHTTWVRPTVVIEVRFTNWTNNKIMRAPIFQRIRTDKSPSECIIERPIDAVISIDKINETTMENDLSYNTFKNSNGTIDEISETIDELHISNIEKKFWPETASHSSITKGDLIEYYSKMCKHLLPFLRDRPLSLSRYPNGITGEAFYQKDWKTKKPRFVKSVKVYSESNNTALNYIVCNNQQTLLWLINLGCIEIHPWNSRVCDYNQCDNMNNVESDKCGLNYPDFIIFDLDPYTNVDTKDESKEPLYSFDSFKTTVEIAHILKSLFDDLKIKSFLKTSGKTGLHIFVPIINYYTYDQTRQFAKVVSQILKQRAPDKITTNWKTSDRKGKIFFDYNQNSFGKTLASVFSVRPVEEATVSVPLEWEKLDEINPMEFTLFNVPDIYRRNNPWTNLLSSKQNLEEILGRISSLNI
ncbi:MAG: DNA ligase D [Thermoproteota archaeon]|nr:DNA ligase D [Thermoproteota archaeon]